MSEIDTLLSNNAAFAERFSEPDVPVVPARKIAVLTCMDARIDVSSLLGLENGDAHVIRNAGGVATDDVLRSLVISQRLLATREIMVIHHTDCGMLTFTDAGLRKEVHDETGVDLPFALEAFDDLDDDVRRSIARIKASAFIPHTDAIRGFVYDVETGDLREVS
jgi:carbonic anhydrase